MGASLFRSYQYADASITNAKLASDAVTNDVVAAAAAIAYTKLALSDSIVNADVNSAAAIAESKLADLGKEGAASLIANIRRRFKEHLRPYVDSGCAPSAGAGLSITVSAGTAYPDGVRIAYGSGSVNGTANTTGGDVWIDSDGSLNAGAAGATPSTGVKIGEYDSGAVNLTYAGTRNGVLKVIAEAAMAFDDATGHNHTGTGGNGTKIGSAALSFAWADNETVAVDGTVGPFALAQSPSPAGSLLLIVEGQVQIAGSGNDYQLSGGNVTFEATRNPPSGSDVRAFYRYSA